MSDAHAHSPSYFTVIVWLTVLTAAEIAVAQFLPQGWLLGTILVVMALVKAAMVAAYFMHLKVEKRTLAWIAVTPLLICTLLVFALMPDATWAAAWHPHF